MTYHDYSDYYEDGDEERPAPYVKGSATSENAARTLTTRGKHARLILGLFLEGGTLTRDEVVAHINQLRRAAGERDIVYSSATARITELSQAGCLEPTGETRITGQGRRAAEVLRLVPGATIETFLRWKEESGSAKSSEVLTLKVWGKNMDAAALRYQLESTAENLQTLGAVALLRPKDPATRQ